MRGKASGEIFANAGLAGATDVADAVAAAKAAQPAWAERSYAERAALLTHNQADRPTIAHDQESRRCL